MQLISQNAPGTSAQSVDQLCTPALVINAPTVRRNIKRLVDYTSQNGFALRPHTKTHKSRMLGQLQIEAGAVGLAVAKVGEAEQMMTVADDLLMAYPALDPSRCQRLAEVARNKTMRVTADSEEAIRALASAAQTAGTTIGVLVDIDVGMHRTGVGTAEDSLKLAQLIDSTSGLRLDGIMCYPGYIWAPIDKQAPLLAAVAAQLQEALDLWARHGLRAEIVSGGSTPTAYQSHLVKQYTELRPGTFAFNDMNTYRGGYCKLEDCAARIICTVVSNTIKDQIVIDGGTKTLTSDLCLPARDSGHGWMLEYPDAKITVLSEEHGQVDVSRCKKQPKLGERVSIIPNHICPCVNLRDAFWWQEEDESLESMPVDARGRLS